MERKKRKKLHQHPLIKLVLAPLFVLIAGTVFCYFVLGVGKPKSSLNTNPTTMDQLTVEDKVNAISATQIENTSSGDCVKVKNIDNDGFTYTWAKNGRLYSSDTSCP